MESSLEISAATYSETLTIVNIRLLDENKNNPFSKCAKMKRAYLTCSLLHALVFFYKIHQVILEVNNVKQIML